MRFRCFSFPLYSEISRLSLRRRHWSQFYRGQIRKAIKSSEKKCRAHLHPLLQRLKRRRRTGAKLKHKKTEQKERSNEKSRGTDSRSKPEINRKNYLSFRLQKIKGHVQQQKHVAKKVMGTLGRLLGITKDL